MEGIRAELQKQFDMVRQEKTRDYGGWKAFYRK